MVKKDVSRIEGDKTKTWRQIIPLMIDKISVWGSGRVGKPLLCVLGVAFCFGVYLALDGRDVIINARVTYGIAMIAINGVPIFIGAVVVNTFYRREIHEKFDYFKKHSKGESTIGRRIIERCNARLKSFYENSCVKLEFVDDWWEALFSEAYNNEKKMIHRDYTISANSVKVFHAYDFSSYPKFVRKRVDKYEGKVELRFLILVNDNIEIRDGNGLHVSSHKIAEAFFIELLEWKFQKPAHFPVKQLHVEIVKNRGLLSGNVAVRLVNTMILDKCLRVKRTKSKNNVLNEALAHFMNPFNVYGDHALSRTLIVPDGEGSHIPHSPELEVNFTPEKIAWATKIFDDVWEESKHIDDFVLENSTAFEALGDGTFFKLVMSHDPYQKK